jgi:hypothetical protein
MMVAFGMRGMTRRGRGALDRAAEAASTWWWMIPELMPVQRRSYTAGRHAGANLCESIHQR